MSTYLQRVEIHLSKLQKKIDAFDAKENEVRRLLAKAEIKRRVPGEDIRKWSKVLTNLEYTLDDVRRRANALEVESNKARQSLAWALAHPDDTPAEEHVTVEALVGKQSSNPHVMDLEQMATLEGQLDDSRIRSPQAVRQQIAAEIEYANQSASRALDESQQRRRQLMLRAAVDKIQARQFDALTRDELQMTIATHSLLSRRLELSEQDKRLMGMLGAAVAVLREQLGGKRRGPQS